MLMLHLCKYDFRLQLSLHLTCVSSKYEYTIKTNAREPKASAEYLVYKTKWRIDTICIG